MQGNDYIDNSTIQRTVWTVEVADDGKRRYVGYETPCTKDQDGRREKKDWREKKIDELLDENSKLTSRLLTLRTIVERGLDCKFTYERIDKPFGIGQMSGECIDAYNTLQQIMKEYDKMFNGYHVTDKNNDWEAQ